MTSDFLSALDEEIAELEKDLQSDPRFVKWRRLTDIARLYRGDTPTSPVGDRYATDWNTWRGAVSQHRVPSARQKALQTAEAAIKGRTTPTRTAEIQKMLEIQGVKLGGANPRNALSAMLSNSPRFVSHGRDGWTVVPSNGVQNAEAAGDSPPAASNRDQPDQLVNPTNIERG